MSLTQFIKTSSVRERVNTVFPNKGGSVTSEKQVEWQTKNYMLVGTAFDYLFRFWLRRNVETAHSRLWIAQKSLELAENHYPEIASDVAQSISRAEDTRDEFLETGQLTRNLIESTIDLARIDGIYRGGALPTDLGVYEDGDIVDCIRLIELLDASDDIVGSEVYLNPTFGLASSFVGGADADAVLDGTLIDAKTTGNATFKAEYWRQLVGYLVLSDAHRMLHRGGIYDQLGMENIPESRPLPEIKSFGVYFSRHGELSTIPASTVYDSENYSEFRSWFVKAALDKYQPFNTEVQGVIRTFF